MTKPSIALSELVEKGADTDLLREMIQHVVQRDDGDGRREPLRRRLRRAQPRPPNSRNGYRERLWETRAGASNSRSRSCAPVVTSRRSWSRAGPRRRRWRP